MKKALYRAYRPQTFDEVLGQDAIVQVLKNQVQSGAPGHAYLFAGVRGTGKTSCAKILSRAVNCLNPQNGNPCNECAHCKAILNETTMDVVEMDAASNRRIDDIRELREKVVYPPVDLKYKVYIIDEAHMITNEGFNALLKIMEEPPEHLIFILATTELEKIPETIRSRVQRYAFRRIGQADVEKNLLRIAQQAGYQLDVDAAASIASHANGAMRDALSALDQLLGDKEHIGIEQVHEILGTVGLTPILSLWNAIFHDDAKQALEQLQFLFQEGKEAHSVYEEMIRILRLSILRKAGVLEGQESDGQEAQLRALIQEVGMDRLLDSMDILMQSEEMSKRSEYAQVLLESCVLRLVDYVDQGQLKSHCGIRIQVGNCGTLDESPRSHSTGIAGFISGSARNSRFILFI